MLRDPAQSGFDGAAGGDPVIDDDHGPPIDRGRRPVADILPAPALDFRELPLFLGIDVAGWRADSAYDVRVQHQLRVLPVDDGAEPQLLMPRRADLAHQQHVERRTERLSHLEPHRYPAARQGQHNRPAAFIVGQRRGQLAAGVAAILE